MMWLGTFEITGFSLGTLKITSFISGWVFVLLCLYILKNLKPFLTDRILNLSEPLFRTFFSAFLLFLLLLYIFIYKK